MKPKNWKDVAPEGAKALEESMKAGQLPPTATEQAIGGRQANPTPKSNPEVALDQAKPATPKPKRKDIKPRAEVIKVRHEYDEPEQARLGRQLAQQQRDLAMVDEEKKSVVKDYSTRTDKIKTEIKRLTNCIQDGFEMVDVDAFSLVAIDRKVKQAKRVWYERGTGKFIREEPMALNGQLDFFALHPHPRNVERTLPDKIIKSVV